MDARVADDRTTAPRIDGNSRVAEGAAFLGQTGPISLAIADFDVHGKTLPPDIGKSVPDRLATRLAGNRFQLVERSRLDRIVEEHDLQGAGVVGGSSEPLTSAAYVLLGGVSSEQGVAVSVRLVEVRTARICRRARACSNSLAGLEAALDQVAALLSASDAEYERIEADRQARQDEALAHSLEPPLKAWREGAALLVTIRSLPDVENEQRLYQQIRQQLRERFAEYCRKELHSPRSKDWLMDYCRLHEDCTDVTTDAGYKVFSFRVPLPP